MRQIFSPKFNSSEFFIENIIFWAPIISHIHPPNIGQIHWHTLDGVSSTPHKFPSGPVNNTSACSGADRLSFSRLIPQRRSGTRCGPSAGQFIHPEQSYGVRFILGKFACAKLTTGCRVKEQRDGTADSLVCQLLTESGGAALGVPANENNGFSENGYGGKSLQFMSRTINLGCESHA